jgi:MFS superfamily sulfate permease-like transporter
MGIAIASGVPTEKAAAVGLLTGIIGGIVVGTFAGSPLLITGPAAGLSVLVYELITRHGWERLGIIVLLAGLMQVTAGLLKLGQWFRAVSPAVIHGMLAGIGVLIFASQFHIMLDDTPRRSGLENILSLPDAFWRAIVPSDDVAHDAARIGVMTIVILVFWKALAPKKIKWLPAPLLAVTAATVTTAIWQPPINLVTLPDNLYSEVSWPSFEGLARLDAWPALLGAALSIAFIASAETLLSAAAVDQMHQGPRTRYDRELTAQGVGNFVSGVVGGLPLTGVIVRSAANVEAGARTNLSEILHGVWLLVFVCVFPFLLRTIPTASLAAVLVYTGYKLVDFKQARKLSAFGKSEVLIYLATAICIVVTDLLAGVLIGLGLSALKLLITFSRLSVSVKDEPEERRTVIRLEGTATFLRLPTLASALEAVPTDRELHVHFEELAYIDHACLDLLMNWEKQHRATGGTLVIDWGSLRARFTDYGKNGNRRQDAPSRSNSGAAYGPALVSQAQP